MTMNTEQALHVHFPFGGCGGHRHSYPPSTNNALSLSLSSSSSVFGKRKKSSGAIPIQSMRKTSSEHQMAQEKEAEADYKDYLFFSRVVGGISRQNSLLEDGSFLKSTNELLIDNIVRSRHERNTEERKNTGYECYDDDDDRNTTATHYYSPATTQQTTTFQDLKIVTPTRKVDGHALIDSVLHEFPHLESDGSGDTDDDDDDCEEHEDEGIFDLEM